MSKKTVINLKLPGTRMKVVYSPPISMEEYSALDSQWRSKTTVEALCEVFRGVGRAAGRACSIYLESVRVNPARVLELGGSTG